MQCSCRKRLAELTTLSGKFLNDVIKATPIIYVHVDHEFMANPVYGKYIMFGISLTEDYTNAN